MHFSAWGRVATFACGSHLSPLPWEYTQPIPGMYTTMCNYEPATGAWATCVEQVLRQHIVESKVESAFSGSIEYVNVVCKKAGGGLSYFTTDRFNASLRNASNYLEDIPSKPQHLNFPVKLEYRNLERKVDAVHAEFANLDNSNDSIMWIYYYFLAVLLALMALRIPSVRRKCLGVKSLNILRSSFQLPTVWNSEKHAQHSAWALGGLFPTSLEASLICGFLLVHAVSLTYNYSVDPREVMETVPLQRLQALGNRSGIVSFGLLPLIILLSSRSNLLPFLTGMRYTTFLVLHRWIGRIAIVDAIIHSIAFYLHESLTGELDRAESQFWWAKGIVATVVSCVILVMAMGSFRSRWYEIFLYTHIALALMFFYYCWDHVRTFGWTYWIFASCIIWALERSNRLYSIVMNGVCHAEATVLNPNLLVLTIPKPKRWTSHPTQYAFVHFLLPSIFWQSHPFTLTDLGNELKLVILVKDGATRVLMRAVQHKADAEGTKSAVIPLLMEGPYGVSPELDDFSSVLLVSGGSGIPGPLALARVLNASTTWSGYIHFVTVAREYDVLQAYHEQLDELLCSHRVKVDLHYTGREVFDSGELILHKNRPNVEELVEDLVSEGNPTAIVCCGPPGLDDKTRNAVSNILKLNPRVRLEYFEEYQIW